MCFYESDETKRKRKRELAFSGNALPQKISGNCGTDEGGITNFMWK